jgi:hypothetical protein
MMPATANESVNDKGELTVTITAAGAAATGLTAGKYDMQIVQRSFQPQQEPRRESQDTEVTGGTITTVSKRRGNYIYRLTLVDDFVKGAAGELGTTPNEFTAVELFWKHWVAEAPLGAITVSPAGSETGMKEYTISAAEVLFVSGPATDADANRPFERTVEIQFDKDAMTIADHA